LNNKISFVKFVLYNWQFKVTTAGSYNCMAPGGLGFTVYK